jgi:hypothetical protein
MNRNSLTRALESHLLNGASEKELLRAFPFFQGNAAALDTFIARNVPEALKTRSHQTHERVFRSFPKPQDFVMGERIWRYQVQQDIQPWIWISLPKTPPWKRIEIVPLSDLHIGAKAHNSKRLDKTIQYIAENDHVFSFFNGDILENALGDSIGGAVYEQIMRPHEQAVYAIEKFRPIAHKIWWAQPGNHEWRSKKHSDIDPLYWICRVLGIPYFDEPIYVDILWKGNVYTAFAQHGATNSQTLGGKLNAAGKPLSFQDFVMFVIMGHVHDKNTDTETRICRERIFDENGKLESFSLQEKKQHVVICPSYYGFFGTYGSRAGYAPTSYGDVTLELYPNGDYHVTG